MLLALHSLYNITLSRIVPGLQGQQILIFLYFLSTLKLVNVALKMVVNKVNGLRYNFHPLTGSIHWII